MQQPRARRDRGLGTRLGQPHNGSARGERLSIGLVKPPGMNRRLQRGQLRMVGRASTAPTDPRACQA